MNLDDPLEMDSIIDEDEIETPVIPEGIQRNRLSGVFSCEDERGHKTYVFAEQIAGEGAPVVQVQPLNKNNLPSGDKESVVLGEFLDKYNSEIEFYQREVFPKMLELDSTLKRAEGHREQGALYSAQFEYEEAIDFDEENVRANFGLGLTYMERGEMAKAKDIFRRVVRLEATFAPEHKHLFNEFGISLRKTEMHDQAVEYYSRALELTEDDENLHYNIARAYHGRGDSAESLYHLRLALELNPDFEEALGFKRYLERRER